MRCPTARKNKCGGETSLSVYGEWAFSSVYLCGTTDLEAVLNLLSDYSKKPFGVGLSPFYFGSMRLCFDPFMNRGVSGGMIEYDFAPY